MVLDRSRAPFYRWFADGVMNTCFNAVDRHVRDGRGQQPALIYDSPVTGSQRTYTYAELRDDGGTVRRGAARPGGRQGRPGDRVPADDPGGADRHAGVRQDRGGALGGVRRVRGPRTRHADRRRDAQGDRLGVLRHRGQPGHRVQADPGPRHRPGQPQAGALRDPAAPAGDRGADRRSRSGLGGRGNGGRTGRLRAGGGDRPAVHPVHLGHHGPAQGRGAGQRRARGRAALEHAGRLRHPSRRGVLGRLRRGLGGRALLHRLRAAAGRVHHDAVRGQAGRHPGRGRVLAGGGRAQGQGAVHRADRVPRDQEGGPGGRAHETVRPVRLRVPVPGGRAARPGDLPVGGRAARHPGHRPLVADRDRLADRGRPDGPGADADQARVADRAGARLRRARPRRRRHRGRARRDRRHRGAAAAAAGLPAHAVARRRAVRRVVPVGPSRLLHHGRRRVPGRATGTCT